jgi:hypothetical protein
VKTTTKLLALMSGGAALALCAAGTRDAKNQRYQAIVERNAFGLRPVPPPPVKPDKPPQKVNIKLTGITTMLGVKKAYFILSDPAKPNTPNALVYPSLKQGERFGPIQVVSIDEKHCSVKIVNAGTPDTLTFSANGNAPNTIGAPLPGQARVPLQARLPAGFSRGAIPPGIIRPPSYFNNLASKYRVR